MIGKVFQFFACTKILIFQILNEFIFPRNEIGHSIQKLGYERIIF